ncbi:tyrosine-protein phosphatase [Robinsoniella peoriensis]|uniref:tyrosine-protein phosphatase n=1 Tax=Robinsoniella peoriensis TaxID=180332 RepID=UPI0005C7E383|nr:CpsB/CapC family capsule biosynthesis tyrosine phosphatase [Robinsoniella peoriensis]
MIDIHTHILPETDDGADSLTEAVEMLKICTQSGVTDVVLTPHGNLTEIFPESRQESINNQFKRLEKRLSELNMQINIYKGMEVFASYNLYDKLSAGTIWTLNQSKYLLTEFSFDTDREILFELLQIIESKGLIPVIAHPERYKTIQKNPQIAYDWNRRGYIIQINKGSIAGVFGRAEKETAHLLLDCNLVQVIASDCHHIHSRMPGLKSVYRYISRNYSEGYAQILFNINPERILRDQQVLIINPRVPGSYLR